MSGINDTRTYLRSECVSFRKTSERYGGLSNMAPGYPVRVNGVRLYTVEALYQACRFPHRPDVQRLIIEQHSPMTAKMVSKPYVPESRPDWDRARVKIMRWCLRLKLATHWPKFSQLLLSTGDRAIVEDSKKDAFWGAIPADTKTLVGMNVLGRLLMELREEVKSGAELRVVLPPSLPNFLLLGEPLTSVDFRIHKGTNVVGAAPPPQTSFDEMLAPVNPVPTSQFAPITLKQLPSEPGERRCGMIEGLIPYAEYRTLSQPWLGHIPASWVLHRAKFLFREVDERSVDGKEELLSVSHKTGVTPRSQKTVTMFMAESNIGHKLCRPDDLVVNTLWAWMAALGVTKHTGLVSPAYSVYRPIHPESFLPRFADMLLRTPAYAGEYQRRSTGVNSSRLRLYPESFLDIPIVVPPPDDQAAVVRFLDHANRKIDGFIRAKRKLITLLGEQKQAIIHRTVTRGLDTSASLKPSGISWLGDIPKHWEVWRIGRFAKVGNGSTPSRSNTVFWSGGTYPWLNSSHANRGFIDSADQFVTQTALRDCHLPRVAAGSVLIAITGQGKTRGTSAVLGIEATINQHMAYITPRTPVVTTEYLQLSLAAAYSTLRSMSDDSGSTKGALTCDDIKRFKIAVPPIREQASLVSSISVETSTANAAIARTQREITLMQEYRTRLTADIVTGKLDVRIAAAKLPESSGEFAPEELARDVETDDEEVEA